MAKPQNKDPRETPRDDPRKQTDWPTHRQTEKPWKGNPEKDQIDPGWQKSNTPIEGSSAILTLNARGRSRLAFEARANLCEAHRLALICCMIEHPFIGE
jgi:hypothetical protein